MKNIYVAKNYDSVPLGLVLADSRDIAGAFFDGKYGGFHSLEEIELETIDTDLPGVTCFNIIETEEYKERINGLRGAERTYRVVKKR